MTIELYDQFAAAYAMATGVRLVKVLPGQLGQWTMYAFDDSDGQASRALGEWKQDKAMVNARAYAEACREVRRLTWAQRQAGEMDKQTN